MGFVLFYVGIMFVTGKSVWWLLSHYPVQCTGVVMMLVGWVVIKWENCDRGIINLFGKIWRKDGKSVKPGGGGIC